MVDSWKAVEMLEDEMLDVCLVTEDMLFDDKQEKLDMVDFTNLPTFKMKGTTSIGHIRNEYSKNNNIDPSRIRLWEVLYRKNKTLRVSTPLALQTCLIQYFSIKNKIVYIFVETSNLRREPFFQPFDNKKSLLIFFKFFHPKDQWVQHIGNSIFEKGDKLSDCLPVAKKLAGISNSRKIHLYEEVKPHRMDLLDDNVKNTFQKSELVSGDILVIQQKGSCWKEVTLEGNIFIKIQGRTKLHQHCARGMKNKVKKELDSRSNPHIQTISGQTPLFMACQKGHTEIAELLIKHQANLETKEKDGLGPLSIACQNGHKEVAELLIASGASLKARDNTGRTPLMIACLNGHEELAEMLLSSGADRNALDDNGAIAFNFALEGNHTPIIDLLATEKST